MSAKKIQRLGLLDVEQAAELVEEELKSESLDNRPEMLILAGEYRRLNGNYKESREWFQELLENHPTAPQKNAALLGMSMVDFESCRAFLKDPSIVVPTETSSRCTTDKDWLSGENSSMDRVRTAQEVNVPNTLNADRYRLLYLAEVDKKSELALVYKEKAQQYAPAHPITQGHYEQDIGMIDWDSPEFKELTEDAKLVSLQDSLAVKDWQTVVPNANIFLEMHPESTQTLQVNAIKERAKVEENYVNKRIAVLLPLSGKYAPAAEAIKQSIEFTLQQTDGLEVQFYDTGWEPVPLVVYKDPENPTEEELASTEDYKLEVIKLNEEIEQTSQRLVKKAVVDDGCGIIVGPLLKEVAPSVAESAQAYGIPMLSLANSSSILSSGDLVRQVSLSLEQQITPLVTHAMEVKQWSTFVAMVPDTDFGTEALETFTRIVEDGGGIVLRHVEYPAKATSFVTEARRLGLKAEVKPSEKQLEKDPTLDHPTLDFDAIFIPDNHRRTPLIASALAAEEFSIGGFRINRHAKPVGVLGLNKWSHPTIVKNGGQYLRNGVFVNAFWQDDPNETVQTFVSEFETEFGKKPVITHALAHDAIIIADEVFKSPQTSRISVQQTLQTARFNNLVTGGQNFTTEQTLQRDLHIMEIKSDRLQKWTPPVIDEDATPK
jgi:ABC-type branched-subunit amino acid transport system substrate-binding protein